MIRRLCIGLMLLVSPAYAIQPCAPFRVITQLWSGSPIDAAVLAYFHTYGNTFNWDPRYLLSVAWRMSNNGNSGCAPITKDLFRRQDCRTFESWQHAISTETARVAFDAPHYGTPLIDANLQREGYGDADDSGNDAFYIIGVFVNVLLGDKVQYLYYSTSCCGDCNGDVFTTINEVIYAVNIFLFNGDLPISSCPKADADFNGVMSVSDLVRDYLSAAYGCPAP